MGPDLRETVLIDLTSKILRQSRQHSVVGTILSSP